MSNINTNARFISSYLGTKRKYGEKIAEVIKLCNEKTLYIAGNTIWYDAVKETIDKYKPHHLVPCFFDIG